MGFGKTLTDFVCKEYLGIVAAICITGGTGLIAWSAHLKNQWEAFGVYTSQQVPHMSQFIALDSAVAEMKIAEDELTRYLPCAVDCADHLPNPQLSAYHLGKVKVVLDSRFAGDVNLRWVGECAAGTIGELMRMPEEREEDFYQVQKNALMRIRQAVEKELENDAQHFDKNIFTQYAAVKDGYGKSGHLSFAGLLLAGFGGFLSLGYLGVLNNRRQKEKGVRKEAR